MSNFTKRIQKIEFAFHSVKEREEMAYWVSGEGQNFKMIRYPDGNWGIWQQVPRWIKDLETELASAISEELQNQQLQPVTVSV
ncbi:MAG: hypothetical protein ACM3VS_16575 [Candidatus Dadabacteria bacterium]